VIGSTAVVGDECYVLHGVTLGSNSSGHDVTHERPSGARRHPTVGRRVTLGAGCAVLGGVTVGDGATVGAGAVVTKSVAAGATVVGANRVVGTAVLAASGMSAPRSAPRSRL